jgi:hypothetical protein
MWLCCNIYDILGNDPVSVSAITGEALPTSVKFKYQNSREKFS